MTSTSPLFALRSHQWFKLICGASYQYLPAIRNLALIYTLAGADCIDIAADPAVVTAAQAGIKKAQTIDSTRSPWLMVSINNGEDLHFRKAFFESSACITNCPQPCKTACPADAINLTGIISDRCYGCGRCLPECPIQIIYTQEQKYDWQSLRHLPVDALEIHTQTERVDSFRQLWQQLADWIPALQVVAVSFPDHPQLHTNLLALLETMQPAPRNLIWQADGQPMSGDLGAHTTERALCLGQKVVDMNLPRGFVQLAGGTNHSTVAKLQDRGIGIHGVAYGSYGRQLVMEILDRVPEGQGIETFPLLLEQALSLSRSLVNSLKTLLPQAHVGTFS